MYRYLYTNKFRLIVSIDRSTRYIRLDVFVLHSMYEIKVDGLFTLKRRVTDLLIRVFTLSCIIYESFVDHLFVRKYNRTIRITDFTLNNRKWFYLLKIKRYSVP